MTHIEKCGWLLLLAVMLLAGCTRATAEDLVPSAGGGGHEGLNVVILGDSNTSIGGDDCSAPRGWNTWFRERFAPATCRSYARSGATWTNTPHTRRNTSEYTERLGNDNVVYNQVERLREAWQQGQQPQPHLILISAGTNDAWFAGERPQAFGKTAAQAFDGPLPAGGAAQMLTLAESVRYVGELLLGMFPDAQVVLLTPMQTTAAPAERIRQAGNIIEQCGQAMGFGVIRLDRESCVSAYRERQGRHFTTDGTHTNEAGARRNGYLIASRVAAMLQF